MSERPYTLLSTARGLPSSPNELHLVVATFFVSDSSAPRFVLLRYALSPRFRDE
jgi:hypothetical protein